MIFIKAGVDGGEEEGEKSVKDHGFKFKLRLVSRRQVCSTGS
jgi:hypothetical protein